MSYEAQESTSARDVRLGKKSEAEFAAEVAALPVAAEKERKRRVKAKSEAEDSFLVSGDPVTVPIIDKEQFALSQAGAPAMDVEAVKAGTAARDRVAAAGAVATGELIDREIDALAVAGAPAMDVEAIKAGSAAQARVAAAGAEAAAAAALRDRGPTGPLLEMPPVEVVPVEPVVVGLDPVVDGYVRKLILLGVAASIFKALK